MNRPVRILLDQEDRSIMPRPGIETPEFSLTARQYSTCAATILQSLENNNPDALAQRAVETLSQLIHGGVIRI